MSDNFSNIPVYGTNFSVSAPLSLVADVLSIPTATSSFDGLLTASDFNIFNNKADINSPNFSGIPLAPTASPGTNTTQLATTSFVLSQGFLTSSGAIPTGSVTSTSVVTAASATFVTAMTSTVTLTQTAQIIADAKVNLKTTSSASVASIRVTINAVAGQSQSISLLNITDNYTGSVQAISTLLAPGTYTINFDISRLSGTGTVNFTQGSLVAEGLQGTNSNGITKLQGDVATPTGSGLQTATIANAAVTGAKIASATISGSNIANATITGSNIAATTITNSNISTVDALKITTGTLPFARGGTNTTAIAAQRIPFSTGTALTTDALFIYDTVNTRLSVGGNGSAVINAVVTSGSHTAMQAYNSSAGNALQAINTTAYTLSLTNRSNSAATGASIGGEFGRGTVVAPLQALSGDQLFVLVANGYTGTQTSPGFNGAISFVASENVTSTACGGDLAFSTTPNGSLVPVENIRIKNSGETIFQKAIASARYTTTDKNALTPVGGWVVFDTSLNQLSYYNGSSWINV